MDDEDLLYNTGRAGTAMHGCRYSHVGTVYVHEMLDGKMVWEGPVEMFNLHGHSQAERAFAWAWDDDGEIRYIAILNVPPINSPARQCRRLLPAGSSARNRKLSTVSTDNSSYATSKSTSASASGYNIVFTPRKSDCRVGGV